MSLYNMVCGVNPCIKSLLAAVDVGLDSVPRLRDAWVDSGLTEVAVYTRTGGRNREGYREENAILQKHPLYLRDSDDPFDETFAQFYFRIPEEKAVELRSQIERVTGGDAYLKDQLMSIITEAAPAKFQKALESLRSAAR